MAEKKTKSKKVISDNKHAIIRTNTIGNVFSYEHTTNTVKEKKDADSTD